MSNARQARLVGFDDGQVLTMSVSSGATLCQSVLLTGTDGWARLDTPFNPAAETTARWAHARDGKEALLAPAPRRGSALRPV